MGISNPVHLAFVAIVALLVLGPKRLPDLARSLGSGMREFRESLNSAMHDDEPELSRTVVQPIPAAAEVDPAAPFDHTDAAAQAAPPEQSSPLERAAPAVPAASPAAAGPPPQA